jgi:hypothetical protein
MGRQIHFYMQSEDRNSFFRFAESHDPVVVALRDADSAQIQPIVDLSVGDRDILSLWNRRILRRLEREWIPDPGYYRVDEMKMPTLEFDFSTRTSGNRPSSRSGTRAWFAGYVRTFAGTRRA